MILFYWMMNFQHFLIPVEAERPEKVKEPRRPTNPLFMLCFYSFKCSKLVSVINCTSFLGYFKKVTQVQCTLKSINYT